VYTALLYIPFIFFPSFLVISLLKACIPPLSSFFSFIICFTGGQHQRGGGRGGGGGAGAPEAGEGFSFSVLCCIFISLYLYLFLVSVFLSVFFYLEGVVV